MRLVAPLLACGTPVDVDDRCETMRLSPAQLVPSHGWIGPLDRPGFRLGNVLAMLDDVPALEPRHLYFDFMLLDADGRTCDNHSASCPAVQRGHDVEYRRCFVRLVVELTRHALADRSELGVTHQAVSLLREQGVGMRAMKAAAQCLDATSSERAVAASIEHLLRVARGDDGAGRLVHAAYRRITGAPHAGRHDERDGAQGSDDGSAPATLQETLLHVVREVGKERARHFVGAFAELDLVPRPDWFGLRQVDELRHR